MSRGWLSGATARLCSDRHRACCHNRHGQYSCYIANVSSNRQECFRYGRMLVRQSLKPRADTVELIDFAQDRCKRHGQTAFLAEKPKVEELQMDWLRSEDLKEEKDVTAPVVIIAEQGRLILGYTSWNTVKSKNWGTWQRDHPLLLLLIFLSQG
jgi:hypothetical protein